MTHILVVDDDPHLREIVRFALVEAGFVVEEAADGKAALKLAKQTPPALVVLDVMMPELNGLEVARQLRASGLAIPILFLSSKDDEIDRVLGLELGGDDYMGKPFSPRELVARVRALLRRGPSVTAVAPVAKAEILEHGPLRLDLHRMKAFWQQHEVELTVTELHLLEAFMRAPRKAFTRDELMRHSHADSIVADRTIDSHIRRLRQKFSQPQAKTKAIGIIETVHGHGYRLFEW